MVLMPAIIISVSKLKASGPRAPKVSYNLDKMVGSGQQSVFLPLSGFSSCAYSPSFPHCIGYCIMSTQVKSQTRQWVKLPRGNGTAIKSLTSIGQWVQGFIVH